MAKAGLAARRAARKRYQKAVKTSKPGAGKRFAALEAAARAGGARNPAAGGAGAGREGRDHGYRTHSWTEPNVACGRHG